MKNAVESLSMLDVLQEKFGKSMLASELYLFLEVQKPFAEWFSELLACRVVSGESYHIFFPESIANNRLASEDCILPLDCAEEILEF